MAAPDRPILLVENDVVIAAQLERILKKAGFVVIGPAGSTAEALMQIVQQDIDAAVLDIGVGHDSAQPVFDVLGYSNIPYLIVGEESAELLPLKHRGRPYLEWPCTDDELLKQLERLLPTT